MPKGAMTEDMLAGLSPIDQVAALKDHLVTREWRIRQLFDESTAQMLELSGLRRQRDDLLAANNSYLQRARLAEGRLLTAEDRLDGARHENAALAALLEKAELAAHPDIVADVQAFHKGCETVDPTSPTVADDRKRELRKKLVSEEVNEELIPALDAEDLVEIADAIADSIYVLVGTALAYGIPLWDVWREVQRSNMSKFDKNGMAIRRADGKILKGPHFVPPNIAQTLGMVHA